MVVIIRYMITVAPISYGNPEIIEKGSIRAQPPARIASRRRITTHAAQSTRRSTGRCRIFTGGLYTSWPADICPASGRAGPSAERPVRHEREQEYIHPEEEPAATTRLVVPLSGRTGDVKTKMIGKKRDITKREINRTFRQFMSNSPVQQVTILDGKLISCSQA
jgi:hypothetical protein